LKALFCCFQVAIHAIGDKANDLVLDVYQSVASMNGVRDRRFRVMFWLKQKISHIVSLDFVTDCGGLSFDFSQ